MFGCADLRKKTAKRHFFEFADLRVCDNTMPSGKDINNRLTKAIYSCTDFWKGFD